ADALSTSSGAIAPHAPQQTDRSARRDARGDDHDSARHAPPRLVATVTENGHAHAGENGNGQADESHVTLRRLTLHSRPLAGPDARDPAGLPVGGTIWIMGDGSPLSEAVGLLLRDRGFHPVILGSDGAGAPEASESLCGVIILASRQPDPGTFIARAFRVIRA